MLWSRIAERRVYVSWAETDKATGAHFTQPRHSLTDLRVSILENTGGKSTLYRKKENIIT